MTRLLRISEIHEFAQVGRIPEAAVTDEIISNVTRLDERTQLEPWIQEIVHSHDRTPHGPTEIADIISTRVSVGGKPTYTAFILKGKSFRKVSVKDVAHQISRLRRLEGLELAVFVAVGDIQDDVYEEFSHKAVELSLDYLVITKFDLARLLIAYDKICGEDGLPFEDGECLSGHVQRPEVELRYKVREEFHWELLRLRDVSNGLARRLCATVLTDKHYTQDAIRSIIAEVVQSIRRDPYLQSRLGGAQWSKSPAHVVWAYLGLDMNDVGNNNWICMACWIDPGLEEQCRPDWSYQELNDDIMITWNSDYQAWKRILTEHTGSKHVVIRSVEGILSQMQPILAQLDQTFTAFCQGVVTEQILKDLVRKYRGNADSMFGEVGVSPLAPPECVDYRQTFQSVMGSFDNLFLYYSSDEFLNERTSESRMRLFGRSLARLKGDLRRLEFEREKLR